MRINAKYKTEDVTVYHIDNAGTAYVSLADGRCRALPWSSLRVATGGQAMAWSADLSGDLPPLALGDDHAG